MFFFPLSSYNVLFLSGKSRSREKWYFRPCEPRECLKPGIKPLRNLWDIYVIIPGDLNMPLGTSVTDIHLLLHLYIPQLSARMLMENSKSIFPRSKVSREEISFFNLHLFFSSRTTIYFHTVNYLKICSSLTKYFSKEMFLWISQGTEPSQKIFHIQFFGLFYVD